MLSTPLLLLTTGWLFVIPEPQEALRESAEAGVKVWSRLPAQTGTG